MTCWILLLWTTARSFVSSKMDGKQTLNCSFCSSQEFYKTPLNFMSVQLRNSWILHHKYKENVFSKPFSVFQTVSQSENWLLVSEKLKKKKTLQKQSNFSIVWKHLETICGKSHVFYLYIHFFRVAREELVLSFHLLCISLMYQPGNHKHVLQSSCFVCI